VQVDPFKPKLKPPGTKRLKLKHDEPLSSFDFNFSLRRYNVVGTSEDMHDVLANKYYDVKVGRCRFAQSNLC